MFSHSIQIHLTHCMPFCLLLIFSKFKISKKFLTLIPSAKVVSRRHLQSMSLCKRSAKLVILVSMTIPENIAMLCVTLVLLLTHKVPPIVFVADLFFQILSIFLKKVQAIS